MTDFKKQILSLILTLSLFLPHMTLAATIPLKLNLDYPEFGGFDLNWDQDLNEIIAWFYYFIISIAGISAFFTFIQGGFQWLTSGGSAGKITEAKEKLTSAVLGLVIILSSYLILQVINPELITLQLPSLL